MNKCFLPVDIVLAPEWWAKNTELTFDRDYFFHPLKRVEAEQRMEKELYERWGKFGLGESHQELRPEVGAVHLAAGYLISEMMGCEVRYSENHPPQVIAANREDYAIDVDAAFQSPAFKDFIRLTEALSQRFGYLTGDVNFGGVLNVAMDLFGQNILMDMMLQPDSVRSAFQAIFSVIDRFTGGVFARTGSTSISVTRLVRHLKKPVFLHSECSHTMISTEDYDDLLRPLDERWSKTWHPFGIHYCGNDPHRYAESFAQIPHLEFLDLGWGGDVKLLRKMLPKTFFSLRLSPVEIAGQSCDEIRETITRLVSESANPYLTGVCCINMDDKVSDDKIEAIFQTVADLKSNVYSK
jgi:hypothetical protein